MAVYNFCYTENMKIRMFIIVIIFITFIKIITMGVFAQDRYAACDLCGYCPPNPPPQSWISCQKCLYPDINSDPSLMESLMVDSETNLPPSPVPGKQYIFLGWWNCLSLSLIRLIHCCNITG